MKVNFPTIMNYYPYGTYANIQNRVAFQDAKSYLLNIATCLSVRKVITSFSLERHRYSRDALNSLSLCFLSVDVSNADFYVTELIPLPCTYIFSNNSIPVKTLDHNGEVALFSFYTWIPWILPKRVFGTHVTGVIVREFYFKCLSVEEFVLVLQLQSGI